MDNNPLRQYFRRPAVYITLPSQGQGYAPDALSLPDNGELPVYPMTAIDEITSKTPDALFNGNAIVELIKSCIPNIKDPWAVLSTDLDAILVAIKVASNNGKYDTESTCPACKETSSYGVNLTGVLASLKPGDYNSELQIKDLSIRFRPLEFKEMNQANMHQFEIQKTLSNLSLIEDEKERELKGQDLIKRITMLTMEIVGGAIFYVKTPETLVTQKEYILDFLQHCDRNTYLAIREHASKLRAATEIKPLDIKCINCEHEYQQSFTLNITDFFD